MITRRPAPECPPVPSAAFEVELAAARRGDRAALGRVLEAHRAYLLLIAGRRQDAALRPKCGESDVVQQTLCEAQQRFGGFRGATPPELRGWLRRTLLHNLRDARRRFALAARRAVGREVPLDASPRREPVDPAPTPGATAAAREEADRLAGALGRLPELYRRVIEWRYREDASYREIGARLGRSEDASRMLVFRAVERLQSEILTAHDDPPERTHVRRGA